MDPAGIDAGTSEAHSFVIARSTDEYPLLIRVAEMAMWRSICLDGSGYVLQLSEVVDEVPLPIDRQGGTDPCLHDGVFEPGIEYRLDVLSVTTQPPGGPTSIVITGSALMVVTAERR